MMLDPNDATPSSRGRGLLRFRADVRTLGFVAAYFVAFLVAWFTKARSPLVVGLEIAVLASLSWFCAVITHNAVHSPLFRSRRWNRAMQVLLSLSYGFPVSDYLPGHNLSHHRYTQTRRDVMRTTKVRTGWNLANFVLFFFFVGPSVTSANRRYVAEVGQYQAAWSSQRMVEIVFVWGVKALFLLIDWKRALLLIGVPHLFAVYAITTVNYLQHDGCDAGHPYNHSRNFVGRLFNWFHFNAGFHGIHHMHPQLHWSELPAAHAAELHPSVHPALEQPSLLAYMARAFVLPGRRVHFTGADWPLPDEGPDEDWIGDRRLRTR